MNENDRIAYIQSYLEEIKEQFDSGHAIEHAYRPALKRLISAFEDIVAVNDPKHSEHGAPDFVFLKKSNSKIIRGYAEAKDITVSLDKTEKTDQMQRYHGYANLFLTDYLEFRFFRNGEKYETISLGEVKNNQLHLMPENGERLMRELEAFLDQTPEKIRSGKRLAQIMGGKAHRIRDNVAVYLEQDGERDQELVRIYEMMKQMLVHDLEPKEFADMYAQTLVYGLFVARYGDDSPANFSRTEARDLVPKSNPFLQHFFDHIVGPNFDTRLAYIVDELCEIFSVSDIADIIHKHLRINNTTADAKDPIIHFYEDFLQEYDAAERKKMGAYYTPVPIVKYIVRQVDKILKEEFGITKGLASTDTINYEVETGQDLRTDRRKAQNTKQTLVIPKVQILDPAVGTATFLNETIKHIHESFKGQEGRWESYVNDNLLKRLYGFELMMAPYTIAHLKLGMTLKETGVENLKDRLGVYLTNTLEEGVPTQQDLLSFGLAEVVSQESRLAAQVKSERPVMVVMGNPPYSGVSSNETKYANALIDKYKVEPGGQQKLQERKHWLNDDYVKFIAFAEDMIAKNGTGIVSMITNNGYLDNPTFRGMRWHLAKTFDKIYVLDLHGNAKKKETAPDGSKDQNVFDIMQGVGIILAVKTGKKPDGELAKVYHADSYGTRQAKFDELGGEIGFAEVQYDTKSVYFVQKDIKGADEYGLGVSLDRLFTKSSVGFVTGNDKVNISFNADEHKEKMDDLLSMDEVDWRSKYSRQKDSRDWQYLFAKNDIKTNRNLDSSLVTYRPFDIRHTLYTGTSRGLYASPQPKVLKHLNDHENMALNICKQFKTGNSYQHIFISDHISESSLVSNRTSEIGSVLPLYIYHDDGTRTPNFAPAELSALTRQLTGEPSPEDVLDYIYAVLHSPLYRAKYKEFLKIDFPRVPAPTQAEFDRLVPLGRSLRQLHLMKSPLVDDFITTYPIAGDNVVEKPRYEGGNVYINDTQYFGSVPQLAWEFYIGGYQPAQKWLKDRKGRKLSGEDIEHYQKIIKILLETDRLMKEIG